MAAATTSGKYWLTSGRFLAAIIGCLGPENANSGRSTGLKPLFKADHRASGIQLLEISWLH
ncbi:hypothetical protein [Ruegeria sp. HKCCD8929]|uniref:hypothetical protein n=1 Tax=Ruegeria sp. HKCCD8929 TaxID=2683006 RepID=UPI00148859B7|nr:hypothetical protein [Ruegeria sp. HKCCD8929]